MDIVDLDKVLDDFEFNEQNSGNPLNAQLEEECQQEVDLSNNNELVLPPVEILANSITNDNCTNNVKPSSRNMVLGYPLKSNLNSPIVFTNIIEYINTGTNQLSLEKENSDIVIDRNEMDNVKVPDVLDQSSCENKEQEQLIPKADSDAQNKLNSCENVERIPITISPDCDTDQDLSDRDLSESIQTSLSYTVDNQGLKVVGFNSTMDDISDTELESYLQQIENEHNNVEVFENAYSDARTETNCVKNSNANEYETPIFSENSTSDYGLCADNDNVINYDSISQASTVEIIDAQATVDNPSEQNSHNVSVVSNKTPESKTSISDEPVSADLVISHPTSLNIPPIVVDFQISSAGQTPMNTDKNFKEYIESSTSSESELSKPDDIISHNVLQIAEVLPTLNIAAATSNTVEESKVNTNENGLLEHSPDSVPLHLLGKMAPYWIPDHDSNTCMQCNVKFTVIKRRHHCRACGQVLCSKCCCMKAKLIYLGNAESRVCLICFEHLANSSDELNNSIGAIGGNIRGTDRPNPNNPMEYCSVIPPHQQVSNSIPSPISVMVPIGVLKREGSQKNRVEKTVMFSDGIRPGSELTKLDHSWDSTDTASTQSISENTHKRELKTPGTCNNGMKSESELGKLDPS